MDKNVVDKVLGNGKIDVLKSVVGVVVSVGVGAIVKNGIKCTTIGRLGIFMRICIWVGTFVLGAMVSDKAVEYTNENIDKGVNKVKEMVASGEI